MARNERGSATVEVALSAATLTLLITGVITSAYLGFAHIWIKYASYEAAICLASKESQSKCREKLEDTINGVLLGKPLANLQLSKFSKRARVSFEVKLFSNVVAKETRTLNLPLKQKKERDHGSFLDFQI